MLDLPYAYSSNGNCFAEHNFLIGMERKLGMDKFPTTDELIKLDFEWSFKNGQTE